ncbi:cupin domain-containing protein [Aquabacter sp. L1I39]|uniref:cupin domain-containing protein n=1 Tax=Aquabacter sp. L1I39 TaxID=2820278 RepID=UPI001ADC1F62|nr:cupin domain-containing protein [Aquabacter sp. L1I39]QTL02284.1 cupin domain-containing protein [Aquabacter sp. L1I39]
MRLDRRRFVSCVVCTAMGYVALGGEADAQSAPPGGGIARAVLDKTPFPGEAHMTLLVTADLEPGAVIARHTHPGVESVYVVKGGGVVRLEGRPDRSMTAGEGLIIPAGLPHLFENGTDATRIAITYVVEKDKPLVTSAPL